MQRNIFSRIQMQQPGSVIDPADPPANGRISAAAFIFIPAETEQFYLWTSWILQQPHKGSVQFFQRIFRQFPAGLGKTAGFRNGIVITGKRGKRSKLGGAIQKRHGGMFLGNGGTGHMQNIFIRKGWGHALCPPICWLRWRAVAPSSRLIPLKMAFLPNFFLICSSAFCR